MTISESKKILITGGTSGIGFELAKILLRQGNIVAVAGYEISKAQTAGEQLALINNNFKVYTFDLSLAGSPKALAEKYLKDFGSIDLLINNAGYATYETFEESSPDEIERMIATNFTAHVLITKHLLGPMIEKRKGIIVNISSIAGEIVMTPNATYCTCKQAINAWSKALSYELERFNIAVRVFCPGRVETSFFDHPTFLRRKVRPEMKAALTAEYVATQIADKLLKSTSFLIHIPRKFKFVSWCYRTIPYIEKFAFRRLMISRIDDYYNNSIPANGHNQLEK